MYQPIRRQKRKISACGICCVIFVTLLTLVFCGLALAIIKSPALRAQLRFLNSEDKAEIESAYESFLVTYHKQYPSLEESQLRKQIFTDNYLKIKAINNKQNDYVLAVNQFADLTDEEFSAQYLRKSRRPPTAVARKTKKATTIDPSINIDWVKEGKVTKVLDQGNCGSCWTFASASVVESTIAIKEGKEPMRLSEQQIVDCVKGDLSHGCEGGEPIDAFTYTKNHGLSLEKDYPYLAYDDICKANTPVVAKVKDYYNISVGDIPTMEKVIQERTFRIAIAASPYAFRFYKSGVVTGACPADDLNHDVVIVGAGTTEDTAKLPYWKVRNSWGPNWGENGYIKVSRAPTANGYGVCGVAVYPTYVKHVNEP